MRPLNKREGKKKKKNNPLVLPRGGAETWMFLVGYLGCLAPRVEPVAAALKNKKKEVSGGRNPPPQSRIVEDAIV